MLENKKIQLFCLAHAGGSTYFYQRLKNALPKYIEYIPIDIAGHGKRLKEPLSTSFDEIIKDATQAILKKCQKPFAIFGHSFGGLLAYMCAHSLRDKKLTEPCHLFLSSPAILEKKQPPISHLPREVFFERMFEFGGIPASSMSEELLEYIEPIIRADFQALEECKSYIYHALSIPITILASTFDMQENDFKIYAHKTHGDFTMHIFEGNHFYIQDNWENIAHIIDKELTEHLK